MGKEGEMHQAVEEALKRMPIKWFEHEMVSFLSVIPTIIVGEQMWSHIPDGDRLYFRVFALGIYLAGTLLDIDSTSKVADGVREAKLQGVIYPVREADPILRNVQSGDEVLRHNGRKMADSFGVMVSVLIPWFGLGWGVARALMALNNYRHVARMDLALEISRQTGQPD